MTRRLLAPLVVLAGISLLAGACTAKDADKAAEDDPMKAMQESMDKEAKK